MKVALLTIGDEILIGQIVNTNSAWIAKRLTAIGAAVVEHVSCGDVDDEIIAGLQRLKLSADAILITGGLGPTHDDRTKDVLCEWIGDTLIEHTETLSALHEMMSRRGAQLSVRNRAQALVPSTCTVIANPIGTAPGMMFELETLLVVSMPGVPAEMQRMMNDVVLPLISTRVNEEGGDVREYRTLVTTGIAEAALADRLEPLDEVTQKGTTIAFLPNTSGVRIRIGVLGVSAGDRFSALDAAERLIRERAGDGIVVASEDVPLAAEVLRRLISSGHTISVAESCTGGALGASLTAVSGSSAAFVGGFLTYSNEAKVLLLGVDPQDLDLHGAVSEEVVRAMALGARQALQTTWALSISGIAGPTGGSKAKPIGTVWIGLAGPNGVRARRYTFGTDRLINRERSVAAALGVLLKELP